MLLLSVIYMQLLEHCSMYKASPKLQAIDAKELHRKRGELMFYEEDLHDPTIILA